MRSSLKKSLYLGLAALSFASVAGTSLASTTASAKTAKHTKKTVKKHVKKHAKKTTKKKAAKKATFPHVTSVVNISNQDASTSAYTLKDGSLYNRPEGVKGSHTTATGLSSSELFMAYQTVKTSDGKTFYKVVSFSDHSHRGFVSADDVNTTSTFTPSANNQNTGAVYLTQAGSTGLYKYPQGSTFKDHTNYTASQTTQYASDPFGITQVATVPATGKTAYYVVDLNNNDVQGWVSTDAVSSSQTRYFNSTKDIKVNFNYNGTTVATQIVNAYDAPASNSDKYANPLSTDRTLNASFVKSLFTAPSDDSGAGFAVQDGTSKDDLAKALAGIGYRVTTADYSYATQNFSNVKLGDTITVNVSKTADANTSTSALSFKSIEPNAQGQWNPSDAKDVTSDEVNFPALSDADKATYQSAFTGAAGQFVDFSKAFTNDPLFKSGGAFAAFDGAKSNISVTSTSQYSNGANGVLAFKSFDDVKAAYAASDSSKGFSLNNADASRLTTVQLGGQYHYAYVYDATATAAYNAKATLNGQPLTVIYDKVPVATPFASTTTSTGFTGYFAK